MIKKILQKGVFKLKLAIVDDEPRWIEMAKQQVVKYWKKEAEIYTYPNGESFLEAMEKFDLILMDIEMPEMDGFDTIKKYRKRNKDGLFLILTTHMEMSTKGYQVEAFRYIDKLKMQEELEEAFDSAKLRFKQDRRVSIPIKYEGEKEIPVKKIIYFEAQLRNIILHTDQGDYETKAVIYAAGAEHAHLGVPGEEELTGRGVSYCATCDGAFFRGKTVAVVGGGDVALEDAIYLARFCQKVYCIHRRDEFRGAHVLQEELKALPNVEILYHTVVTEIAGSEHVEEICLKNVITEEEEKLTVDGVFIAVGIRPNTGILSELVSCEGGYVLAGEDCATDCDGIFAAGDVRKKPLRQIVTAVADGAVAIKMIG